MQQQQQQQQPEQQGSVPSTPVLGPDQIPPADLGVAGPPPGFIPLPEGLPVPAASSVAPAVGVDTSQPPPLRPPEGGLPAPGLQGIPAGMPGAITGVPPPGAMPMVSPFALPNVPRKLLLMAKDLFMLLRFTPIQTGPGAHPTSCMVGTGSFLGVQQVGCGIDHASPTGAEVKERVEHASISPSGPPWPVLGRTLPLSSSVRKIFAAHSVCVFAVPPEVTFMQKCSTFTVHWVKSCLQMVVPPTTRD
jgi:hypothetical protein